MNYLTKQISKFLILLIVNLIFTSSYAQSLNDRLIVAVQNNDEKEVIDLLRYGQNPNFMDKSGQTPLFYAVKNHYVLITQKLLKSGANPNLADDSSVYPLIEAVTSTDTALVYLLLQNGANPDVTDYYFNITPLMIAVSLNNYDISELLLYYNAKPDYVAKDSTALIYAIQYNADTSIINLLLRYGADPNFHPPNTSSPLFLAMKKGNTAVLQILKHNGASYQADEADIDFAFKNYDKKMTDFLLPYFATSCKKLHNEALDLDFRYAARSIRKLSGKKYLLPYFNSMFLSFGTSFTFFNDILWRTGLGINEARYDFNFDFEVSSRFAPTKDLIQTDEHTFLQVRDKRTILSAVVSKRFLLWSKAENLNYFYIEANYNYSFGSYRGLLMPIKNKAVFGASAGFIKRKKFFEYYVGYSYLPIQNRNPHYLTLGCRLIINFPKE